jgi:hypothetical protein
MPIVDRVLPFPHIPRLRQAKASLRDTTHAGVYRLMALAPILGQTNPAGVPVVEHVMRNLIDEPPDRPTEAERHTRIKTTLRAIEGELRQARQLRALLITLRDLDQNLSAAS